MAEVVSAEGQCVIYDERVVRGIAKLVSEKEFAELPNKAAKACGATKPQPAIAVLQRSSYAAYVRAVCDTSRRLKVDPLQIEQFLFGVG